MLKRAVISGVLLTAAFLAAASAADIKRPLGVVEMFTSQSCASCPPADRSVEELADTDDVIVLAYHVDYWNYLGWTDTMSSAENTKRQYQYGKALGRSGVYTPQAVLNGRVQTIGKGASYLRQKLSGLAEEKRGLSVPVTASFDGDEVDINVGAGEGKADVLVVYFNSHQRVEIEKGENKGKVIDYRNIVTDIQTVGMWHGEPLSITLPSRVLEPRTSDGAAILLQEVDDNGNPKAILGATLLRSGTS